MSQMLLDLSKEYLQENQSIEFYIKTFESIFKDKRFKNSHSITKDTLKELYKAREENNAKTVFYRKLYQKSERS